MAEWLRGNALWLSAAIGGIVFNIILQKGYLDRVPDPLLGFVSVVVACLFVYGVWHHSAVNKLLVKLYSRNAKMLYLGLIILGAIIGGCVGAVGYWSIKKQNESVASRQVDRRPSLSEQVFTGTPPPAISTSDAETVRQLTESNKLLVEEIRRLLAAQGEKAEPKNLLERYPLGYVIFDINYQNSVFPYDKRLLDRFNFDWSKVMLRSMGEGKVSIQLPNISYRGQSTQMQDVSKVMLKQAGQRTRAVQLPGARVNVEILAVRNEGVVFAIGFERGPE